MEICGIDNKMEFSKDKCKALHMGKNTLTNTEWAIIGMVVTAKKHLRIMVDHKLNINQS